MKEQGLQKTIEETLQKVQADVCDNLCKYRKTVDKDLICDYMREHDGRCPLDALL